VTDSYRHTLPDDVAEFLRAARLRAGWSFRAAARETGISRGMLCEIEHGRRAPSAEVAGLLCRHYPLSMAERARLLTVAIPGAGRSWRPRSKTPGISPAGR
jgi:transcriptional regulator with XRE-family HTH domain